MDNQKNNFSENNFNADSQLDLLFKEALENHSVPAEDHVWRRIQSGMADKGVAPITKTMAKRTYLPIWSAVSGVAASLLIWAIFFTPSTTENVNSNVVADSDKIEEVNTNLNTVEDITSTKVASLIDNSENGKNNIKNQETEATSTQVVASKKQQIPPTITNINTSSKNKIYKVDINEAVASLEKDQTKIKKQSQERMKQKTFKDPSTHIADNVWASDFVVHSADNPFKKENQNTDVHRLNLDNHTVAITVKVGDNESYNAPSQATGLDRNQNPTQLDKAKNVLKEVWNLKTGKKVNLQKILPNNDNDKTTERKSTQNDSNSTTEIYAD